MGAHVIIVLILIPVHVIILPIKTEVEVIWPLRRVRERAPRVNTEALPETEEVLITLYNNPLIIHEYNPDNPDFITCGASSYPLITPR